MKKLSQILNKITVFKKIAIIYISCAIVPLIAVSLFYYNITFYRIEKQRVNNIQHSLNIAKERLQNSFFECFALANKLYLSETIYETLGRADGVASNNIKIAKTIDNYIDYLPIYDSIKDVYLYCDGLSVFNSGRLRVIN
jgi:CRISPR/Cas system-associated endoribonuclease Cas2